MGEVNDPGKYIVSFHEDPASNDQLGNSVYIL